MTACHSVSIIHLIHKNKNNLIFSDQATSTMEKLSKRHIADITVYKYFCSSFPRKQLDDISQLLLQYDVAICLSSSQWDMNRNKMCHFQAKVFERCVFPTFLHASPPSSRYNNDKAIENDGARRIELLTDQKHSHHAVVQAITHFWGLFIFTEYSMLNSI